MRGAKPRKASASTGAAVDLSQLSPLRTRCLKAFNDLKLDRALGLDINLTSTGWALLDAKDLYDKAVVLEDGVFKILKDAQPARGALNIAVGVEDFVRAFGGMSWRTVDIMRLAQLNSILSYSLYRRTGTRPTKFYPASYRSHFGLKKTGKKDIKQISFDYVSTQLPSYPWTKARTGTLHKTNYDIVDAYLCARYTLKRYREDMLLNDADLKKEFATELAARRTALANAGGQKWHDKLDDAWTKEARFISNLVFPKRASDGDGGSDNTSDNSTN